MFSLVPAVPSRVYNIMNDQSDQTGEIRLPRTVITNKLVQRIATPKPKLILRRSSSFGGGPPLLQDPVKQERKTASRWLVLLLTCLLLFGNFYAFDTPASLNIPLREYLGVDYENWQYYLNLFYSVYSFPNMFLPLLGGQLLDRFDKRYVLVCLSTLVCVGQTLFTFGVWLRDIRVMILGRFIFGLGGESLSVTQASITTLWFQGKELAFALGMTICISRLGSVVNSILSPRISNMAGSFASISFSTVVCYGSFVCSVVLALLMSVGKTESSERTPLISRPDSDSDESARNSKFRLPVSFWVLTFILVSLYGTVIPFNTTASDFLMSKWYPNDIEMAGFVMRYSSTYIAFLIYFPQ
jgi:MFS family permease